MAVMALSGAASAQFFDDFNRADGPIGSNYDFISGGALNVSSNMLAGSTASAGLTLVKSSVFTGSYSGTTVQADFSLIDQATTLTYCGLVLGNDGTTTADHGFMVKLQRQGSAGFDNIGIYTGQSTNSANMTTAGGNFQALPGSFSTVRLTIWCSTPTTLNVGLDTDLNGTNDVSYTSTINTGAFTFGNRVGMSIFGTTGRIDNYRAFATTVPEPATMAILGMGALALIRRRRKA